MLLHSIDRIAGEKVAEVVRHHAHQAVAGFQTRPSDVGGDDEIGCAQQRAIRRHRLHLQHVHTRTQQMTAVQGGAQGAVVSEFSTHSTDETDVFTDTEIVRMPTIEND